MALKLLGVCSSDTGYRHLGAYTSSPSYYGTFDQGGNVVEFNETATSSGTRGLRGASWWETAEDLLASHREHLSPAYELIGFDLGFCVATIPDLPGDFNHDGTVDAADYVVWRKNPGGIYTQDDYNTWRAHFGQSFSFTGGSGGKANVPIPEPATLVLLIMAATCLRSRRRRYA